MELEMAITAQTGHRRKRCEWQKAAALSRKEESTAGGRARSISDSLQPCGYNFADTAGQPEAVLL